jgi:hypothetical protein
VAIDLLLGCRELRAIVCVGAAIAIPSDARDKNQEFQAIPAGNIEIEKRRRGAPRPRALVIRPMGLGRPHMATENGRGGELIYRAHENPPLPSAKATDADWAALDETTERHWKDVVADFTEAMLDIDRAATAREIGDLKRAIHELELKVAETSGAVRVLRTGKSLCVRGTFIPGTRYEQYDVVAVNGCSFIAREDNPGQCPGEGWQLLASAGRRGARGFVGPKGERGEPGESATAGPGFKAFHVDRKTYTMSIITTDGQVHALPLRGLFEQFLSDVREGLEL